MLNQLIVALRMTIVMTILTGVAYPGAITWMAKRWFPAQANGSLLTKNGTIIGSSLIGQTFTRPEYFHPRPSAVKYDASLSGGSNLGPTSQVLMDRVRADVQSFRESNSESSGPLPADLVTASGSGLDPHISPASAKAQIARVAQARGVASSEIERLVQENTEQRQLGFLGEPSVNVLLLNLALDQRFPPRTP
jgi:K+-transporting ATPase ATPase C chain